MKCMSLQKLKNIFLKDLQKTLVQKSEESPVYH